MSATSFGGSFNLVASNDKKLKNLFHDRLKRAAIDAQFPFIKYLPFVPPSQSEEFNNMIDGIISIPSDEQCEKYLPSRSHSPDDAALPR